MFENHDNVVAFEVTDGRELGFLRVPTHGNVGREKGTLLRAFLDLWVFQERCRADIGRQFNNLNSCE